MDKELLGRWLHRVAGKKMDEGVEDVCVHV